VRPWSITCRVSAPASVGPAPRPARGGRQRRWRRNYGPAATNRVGAAAHWKAAVAPALAGIPDRSVSSARPGFGLINRMRWREKALPRFIDKNAALALRRVCRCRRNAGTAARFQRRIALAAGKRLGAGPAVALAPGSVGASKRWTYYPQAATLLAEHGLDVWVIGGPGENSAGAGNRAVGPRVRDLTGQICATVYLQWRPPASRSPNELQA